ncbi:MAG TPA: thioredoxin family protein [Mycobacteriales bacterium]|nr:thioredoxin family protein [Mycobacteriales bacterium]
MVHPAGLLPLAMARLSSLLVVLAAATAFGLWSRRANGRVRAARPGPAGPAATIITASPASAEHAALAALGIQPGHVTMLQFSTAFCAPCRATRQVLAEVVRMLPAVRHVEVDAESHLDAVRALGIRRTPTVLVVDRAGQIVKRASGQPHVAAVVAAVAPYLTPEPDL